MYAPQPVAAFAPPSSSEQLPTFLRLMARALEDLAMNEELRRARELGALEPVPIETDLDLGAWSSLQIPDEPRHDQERRRRRPRRRHERRE
jgi:hypothetical protein